MELTIVYPLGQSCAAVSLSYSELWKLDVQKGGDRCSLESRVELGWAGQVGSYALTARTGEVCKQIDAKPDHPYHFP